MKKKSKPVSPTDCFKVAKHSKTNLRNPDDMELPDGFPPGIAAEVMRQMDEAETRRASPVPVVFPMGD